MTMLAWWAVGTVIWWLLCGIGYLVSELSGKP